METMAHRRITVDVVDGKAFSFFHYCGDGEVGGASARKAAVEEGRVRGMRLTTVRAAQHGDGWDVTAEEA